MENSYIFIRLLKAWRENLHTVSWEAVLIRLMPFIAKHAVHFWKLPEVRRSDNEVAVNAGFEESAFAARCRTALAVTGDLPAMSRPREAIRDGSQIGSVGQVHGICLDTSVEMWATLHVETDRK